MDALDQRSGRMRWYSLVFPALMGIAAFGQCVEPIDPGSRVIWNGFASAGQVRPSMPLLAPFKPNLAAPGERFSVIASPWSYRSLGIFCKAEVKMNRWFPIPVMVRLGDVQRAEELDGKGADHGPR